MANASMNSKFESEFRKKLPLKKSDEPLYNLDGCEYFSTSPEMFFRDGKRRIDFVIAYRRKKDNETRKSNRFAFLTALAEQMIEIEVEDCHGNILGMTDPLSESEKEPNMNNFHDENFYDPVRNVQLAEHNDIENAILATDDVVFVKLHATWMVCERVAEVLQLRKPIKQNNIETLDMESYDNCCSCLKLDKKDVRVVPTPYTAPFSRARLFLFNITDYDAFFTPTERSAIVDFVLKRTGTNESPLAHPARRTTMDATSEHDVNVELASGARPEDIELVRKGKIDLGIDALISDGSFEAYFTLHDPSQAMLELLSAKQNKSTSPVENEKDVEPRNQIETNMRIMLTNQWSSWKHMLKYQPLDYVRLYFGESVALYFAWLGLYTTWLLPVAIFGLLVFLLAAVGITGDNEIDDICDRGHQIVMCPPCSVKNCKFWTLNASCFSMKLTRLVDNGGTVLFAIFMALWATIFMEQWKRYQNQLAYRWKVHNLEAVDEPPRPEFLALLNKKGFKSEINPVTQRKEPVLSLTRQIPIICVTYASVLFGVFLALAFLIGVIFYRLIISVILLQNDNAFINATAGIITTITSSCINLVCIFILKMIYDKVAVVMTNIENHRTQSEYDDSLTLKLYLLQFVNFYSSIFYIAYVQGTSAAIPGDTSVAIRSNGCDNGNCLFQLFIQLAIVMVGKQFMNFVTENTLPPLKRFAKLLLAKRRGRRYIKNSEKKLKNGDKSGNYGSLETGEKVAEPVDDVARLYLCRTNLTLIDAGSRPLFEEYLEMLIQYGFITMFVSAFPVAPMFAILNNMFEIRTDASKFLLLLRRPVIKRDKSIGIWFSILSVISSIAIRTNACLIAFTTGFINRMIYLFYYSDNNSLEGYLDFSLSYMNVSRFTKSERDLRILNGSDYCRYPDFRQPPWGEDPYEYTPVFWHILAVKFAFVLVFENVAIALTSIISEVIPDMPNRLSIVARHEARVVNDLILRGETHDDGDKSTHLKEPPTADAPLKYRSFEMQPDNLKIEE